MKKTVNNTSSLHERAMDIAEQAYLLQRKKSPEAIELFEQAFDLEKQAALQLKDSLNAEPSRSILFKGAACLALNAENYTQAAEMVKYALQGRPPLQIKEEIEALQQEIDVYFLSKKRKNKMQALMSEINALPENMQQEVEDFVLRLRKKTNLSTGTSK